MNGTKKKLVSVDFTKKAVILTQWAKSPKKQSVGVYFCFFGDFAHWKNFYYCLLYVNSLSAII